MVPTSALKFSGAHAGQRVASSRSTPDKTAASMLGPAPTRALAVFGEGKLVGEHLHDAFRDFGPDDNAIR